MVKELKRFVIGAVGLCLLFASTTGGSTAYARQLLNSNYKQNLTAGIRYFDYNDCLNLGGTPDGSQTTIIGDSITVGAASKLESTIPGIDIYAQVGKQFGTSNDAAVTQNPAISNTNSATPTGFSIIKQLKANEENDNPDDATLRDYVVIALGTNGTISSGAIQAMVDELGEDRTIVFVNNYKNDGNYGTSEDAYTTNNAAFKKAAQDNSNVSVADWATLAQSDNLVNDDDVHLRDSAANTAFAVMIYDALAKVVRTEALGGGSLDGPAPTSLNGEDNAQKVWNYFKARGLTDIAAAGAMGNLQSESSAFDPFMGEVGGGGGYGIIQWTPANSINSKGGDKVMTNRGESGTAYDKIKAYDAAGDVDGGLLFELDALWEYGGLSFWESMNQETSVGSYTNPPAANSIGQYTGNYQGQGSAYHFHATIERSGDMDWNLNSNGEPSPSSNGHGNIRKRPYYAEQWQQKYGGTGGVICEDVAILYSGNILSSIEKMIQLANEDGRTSEYSTPGMRTQAKIDAWVNGSEKNLLLDCSGFVSAIMYLAFGTYESISSSTIAASNNYEEVSLSSVQPGDVFAYNSPTGHAGIITRVENGQITQIAETNGSDINFGYSTWPSGGQGNDTKYYRFIGGNQ